MQARDYLKYIVEEIHSTVFATVDEKGCPVTCAIGMMDCDESGLYFLTAKGKKFYGRLKANENIAFTAMKGRFLSPAHRQRKNLPTLWEAWRDQTILQFPRRF